MLLRSNFSSFPQYFQYISNFWSQITYSFVKCAVRFIVFLISANLICRSTDISKCFRESLGIRDNKNRLYLNYYKMASRLEVTFVFCKVAAHTTKFYLKFSHAKHFLNTERGKALLAFANYYMNWSKTHHSWLLLKQYL